MFLLNTLCLTVRFADAGRAWYDAAWYTCNRADTVTARRRLKSNQIKSKAAVLPNRHEINPQLTEIKANRIKIECARAHARRDGAHWDMYAPHSDMRKSHWGPHTGVHIAIRARACLKHVRS